MKILIIGLDGATFDLIKPWAEEGKLPTFRKLMKEGAWGELESTIPPISGPAWLALATGRNPGKTGVIDFLKRGEESYKLNVMNSGDFWGKSLWDYLSARDKKVGVMNYPMLFPPYKVNGFMISGFRASKLTNICFPKTLKNRIKGIVRKEIAVRMLGERGGGEEVYIERITDLLDVRARVVYSLMEKENWDFFMTVFTTTDRIQHRGWKYLDERYPFHDRNKAQKLKKRFATFWKKVDETVAEIINRCKDEANILIVSDHGFGIHDECFNLARWLEEKGYLVRKTKKNRTKKSSSLLKKISPVILNLRYSPFQRFIPQSLFTKMYTFVETRSMQQIDFRRSKAYTLPHTLPAGAIYLNCAEEKRELLKQGIIENLKKLNQDIGRDVKVEVFETDKIYHGRYLNQLPEILFAIDNWRCHITKENFDDALFKPESSSQQVTGTHRMNGIFLGYGPDFTRGVTIEGAKIYDIAPTILYIMDLPIPKDMDGKILKEALKDISRAPRYEEIETEKINRTILGKGEEDEIKERLKGLGYLE